MGKGMGKNLTKQFGNISIVDCLCCWQKYACVELIYTYVMFVKCTFQFFFFYFALSQIE
jgi:hypothetical protein